MQLLDSSVSRRAFLAGAAASGLAGAASAMGMTVSIADEAVTATETNGLPSWCTMPEPVDESKVTEVVDVDFCVVGVGVSGVVAAAKAVDLGMKTIAIDAGPALPTGPQWIAAVGSRKMNDAGVLLDRAEIVNDLMWYANYRADQKLIQLWFDRSGEMMDWYCDVAESTGEVEIAIETDLKDTGGKHLSPAIAHSPVEAPFMPMGPNPNGIWRANDVIITRAEKNGLDLRFDTRGRELITDEDGNVIGIYADLPEDGGVLRINASKGVLLSTGGYVHNDVMRQALNPVQEATTSVSFGNGKYMGDGIKMAMQVGGFMSDVHWWCDSDRGLPDGSKWVPGSQPWLHTNIYGNRFCNEDGPYDYIGYAGSMQPDHKWWIFFDNNYWTQLEQNHTTICSRSYPVLGAINSSNVCQSAEEFADRYIQKVRDKGFLAEGETLEELVENMKVIDNRMDFDTLKATIERYNELADKGVDEDFGKIGFRLQHLNQPPYYAVLMNPAIINNLDGIRVNNKVEAIRPDGSAIKGLYVAGNDAGGMYGMTYPWYYGGLNCGFGTTFAYIAAINASER